MRFRKKPIDVQAYQWTGADRLSWPDWLKEAADKEEFMTPSGERPYIDSFDGKFPVEEGDWIVLENGELTCHNPDYFNEAYEPATN